MMIYTKLDISLLKGRRFQPSYFRSSSVKQVDANLKKSKVKPSLYTPSRRLGGEEV
jgi:hypothetical protein